MPPTEQCRGYSYLSSLQRPCTTLLIVAESVGLPMLEVVAH